MGEPLETTTLDRGPSQHATSPVTLIAPSKGWVPINFRELWNFRELLYFLVWRDIKVRYKQTVLGIAWAIIQPLFTMVVFTLFFGKLAKIPSEGIPYPLFSFAALVPWTFFANGLGQSSNSLVGGGGLISKVYFPRLILPLASVLAAVVDFAIAFVILLGMGIAYGIVPGFRAVAVVPLFALAFLTSLGVGLWLSALNVRYRDVRYVIPFLVQIWLFSTPIAYPASLLSHKWQLVYSLNPMVGVVEGFRWALVGTSTSPRPLILISTGVAILILVSGAFYFKRMERTFADVI